MTPKKILIRNYVDRIKELEAGLKEAQQDAFKAAAIGEKYILKLKNLEAYEKKTIKLEAEVMKWMEYWRKSEVNKDALIVENEKLRKIRRRLAETVYYNTQFGSYIRPLKDKKGNIIEETYNEKKERRIREYEEWSEEESK